MNARDWIDGKAYRWSIMEEEPGSCLPSKKYLNLFFFLLSPTQLQFEVFHSIQDKREQGSSHTQISGWDNLSTQTPPPCLFCQQGMHLPGWQHFKANTSSAKADPPTPIPWTLSLEPGWGSLPWNWKHCLSISAWWKQSVYTGGSAFYPVTQVFFFFASSSILPVAGLWPGRGWEKSESKRGVFFIRIAFWWNRLILPSLIKK